MSNNNINELFITNEVRDYIKNINNLIKSGNSVITETLTCSLYCGLCSLMYYIFDFDFLETEKTFKKYLSYLINSNDTKENKKNKIIIFVDFLKINARDSNMVILKQMLIEKKDDLMSLFGSPNNKENEKNIEYILKCFGLNVRYASNIRYHDNIRKKLKNNPDDAKLFLEFFNIVECDDNVCNNPKNIYDTKNENGRFVLKKKDNVIKLLELFNGKSVKVIVTDQDIKKIKSYEIYYNNYIKELTEFYVDKTINDIKNDSKNDSENDNNIQNGGGFLDLFKIESFINLLKKTFNDILNNLYNKYINYSKNVSEIFKLDWIGGLFTISNIAVRKDFNDIPDDFVYTMSHLHEYIGSFLYKSLSSFIKLFDSQKNFVSIVTNKSKNNLQLYLKERSKPNMDILNFFDVSLKGDESLKYFEKESSKYINMLGGLKTSKMTKSFGSQYNCFILPNLKQSLLKVLINVYNINIIELYVPKKFEKCNISNYNSYTIKITPIDKIDCLNKTNLFRTKNNNSNIYEIWENTNKFLNSPNISTNHNYFQILKDSIYSKDLNYHFGGSIEDIDKNKKFIRTVNTDVEMGYYYEVGDLLKKALTKLNNNGIYLKEEDINKIKNNIEILKNNEKKLAEYAKKITDAIKISNIVNNKNKILNEKTLEQYINDHKILLESSDKIAIKLNNMLIKFIRTSL